MLDDIFMQILDMTKIGSVVILVVILARLLLKGAPKVFSYALWAVVLLRLLCPVSFESSVSLVPEVTPVARNYTLQDESISILGPGKRPIRRWVMPSTVVWEFSTSAQRSWKRTVPRNM